VTRCDVEPLVKGDEPATWHVSDVVSQNCENCGVAEVTTDPASTTGVFGYALDGDRARALWALSERLVGERFG
jgi:hypothetical protein